MDIQFERSYPTPVSNWTFLPLLLSSLSRQKHSPDASTSIHNKYDYIVVGTGTAGSVVASRLSENPYVSVLLLEAGHKPPRLTEVPAFSVYFIDTDVDWQFETVPQKHAALGTRNRKVPWPAGKMLGGTSNQNEMVYIRGNRKNYDDWEALGAKGWSYKDVFPYFLKLEDNRSPAFLANGYHNIGGPMTVEDPVYNPDNKIAINEAAKTLGYAFVDSNAARQTGFSRIQKNVRDQQRCSTVKAYLVPAENRTNLDIFLNAMVTKVILKKKRATGVQFYHNGKYRTVTANREVVLSAGTVNTPKLLMLSGIGPREELKKFGIPVISDLPVGKNLQDHPASYLMAEQRAGTKSLYENLSNPSNILQYITNRSGPLTEIFLMQAFLNDGNATPCTHFPNYGIVVNLFPDNLVRGLHLKQEIHKKFKELYGEKALITCMPTGFEPKSRGTITLNSSNPFEPPLIDPNYLEHPDDAQSVADGFKLCVRLFSAAPVSKLGIKPFTTLMPGCEKYHESEDKYYRCYAKTVTHTNCHYVGTCKMGDKNDPTTVVDPKLRVKNIHGLRVVDASIMPLIPSGDIQIPTVMIAEKASDIIKKFYSQFGK